MRVTTQIPIKRNSLKRAYKTGTKPAMGFPVAYCVVQPCPFPPREADTAQGLSMLRQVETSA
jgi:hypothetical protein